MSCGMCAARLRWLRLQELRWMLCPGRGWRRGGGAWGGLGWEAHRARDSWLTTVDYCTFGGQPADTLRPACPPASYCVSCLAASSGKPSLVPRVFLSSKRMTAAYSGWWRVCMPCGRLVRWLWCMVPGPLSLLPWTPSLSSCLPASYLNARDLSLLALQPCPRFTSATGCQPHVALRALPCDVQEAICIRWHVLLRLVGTLVTVAPIGAELVGRGRGGRGEAGGIGGRGVAGGRVKT